MCLFKQGRSFAEFIPCRQDEILRCAQNDRHGVQHDNRDTGSHSEPHTGRCLTMQKSVHRLLSFLSLVLLLSCSTVPITGRQQLSLVSSSTLNSMSFQQYKEFLSQHKVVKGTSEAAQVGKVGRRIQGAVEDYCRANNLSSRLEGY